MKKGILLSAAVLIIISAHAQMPAMVQDIAPGRHHGMPGGMLTWHGKMYFVAFDTAHGYELWSYDERNPAQLVFDFNPGSGNGVAAIGVYKDKLFFSGDNGSGYEVYSYDGISSPIKLTSIWPKANSGPPGGFTVAGNTLFFVASHYRPNAQYPGVVTDLFSYDGSDTPKFYAPTPSNRFGLMPQSLIEYNSKLYFSGTTITMPGIRELHELDPATGNIRILHDLPGTTDKAYHFFGPIVSGNKLYFTAYHIKHLTATTADTTTEGCELHSWDGNTIRQLTALGPGLYPGVKIGLAGYKGAVYFGGLDPDSTFQLYSFNPATGTTNLACKVNPPINGGGMLDGMIAYNSKLYFVAYTPSAGYELWQYDEEGCGMLMDIWPGKGQGVHPNHPSYHVYNGHLYFSANDSVHGQELWRIEGTTGIKRITWNGSVIAYPNPALANATLDISLMEAQSLRVTVVDANGRRLFGAALENLSAGKRKVVVPMRSWASGMYFYQINDVEGRRLASGRIIHQ